MYLPTFYKMGFETFVFKTKRLSGVAAPVTLWGKYFKVYFY